MMKCLMVVTGYMVTITKTSEIGSCQVRMVVFVIIGLYERVIESMFIIYIYIYIRRSY